MRAFRRPQKAKPESRSSSTSSARSGPIPKSKKLQKALNSLSAFLNRFEQIDHTIFETVTNLNSFICDILSSTQKHPSHVNYNEFLNSWARIKIQLSNNIITLNNTQLSGLVDEELNKFMVIINQVDQNPPSNQKQQRDSKNASRAIISVINSARASINKKQFDKLKIQMQNLRSDISHQYESFFKNSQINKEWKDTVIDDSRRSLDKIISFCDIGKELGLTQFPFVDEITILLNELANESEIMRDNAKSMIPRHSPSKFDQRRSVQLPQDEENTPVKTNIKRVPYSARSKSEQSSSKISRIPKPKEQTTPDRPMTSKKVRSSLTNSIPSQEQKMFDHTNEAEDLPNVKPKVAISARVTRNSYVKTESKAKSINKTENEPINNKPKPALSRSQKPVRASSISNTSKPVTSFEINSLNKTANKESNNYRISKKKEIVPLQESPKIQRKANAKNNLSSSQQVSFNIKKSNLEEESSYSGQNINPIKNKNNIKNNDLIDDVMSDLSLFEKRFVKYIATIGTNDLLGRFVNELRTIQSNIENNQTNLPQHISKLKDLMDQIEEQMDISKPLFEIEQNLQQALSQMSNLSNSMTSSVASNAELAEANTLSKLFESIKEQLEKIVSERANDAENNLTNQIEIELEKFKNAEDTFRNAHENNETLKRLRKENIEMRKELQNQNKSKKNENPHKLENYKKIIIEMKAVSQRMSDIQIERKENPEEIDEIDAEIEALLEQQNGLIEQLSNFDF